MKIRIERPNDRVERDVRVYLNDVEVSHAVTAVSLNMAVGKLAGVTLELLGEVDVQTVDRSEWRKEEQPA